MRAEKAATLREFHFEPGLCIPDQCVVINARLDGMMGVQICAIPSASSVYQRVHIS